MSKSTTEFRYTTEQKKSLYRWAAVFYFATVVFPAVYQILSESIEWVPGSFSNALFKSLKLVIPFLLAHGIFFQVQRAMGLAEGTWGAKKTSGGQ